MAGPCLHTCVICLVAPKVASAVDHESTLHVAFAKTDSLVGMLVQQSAQACQNACQWLFLHSVLHTIRLDIQRY